jgi:hypothetical protein
MIVPVVTILYGTLHGTVPYPFTLVILFLVVLYDDQSLTAWRGDAATVRDHPRRCFGVVLERPCKCKQLEEPL